jgi:preprotein translocase subunit SecY
LYAKTQGGILDIFNTFSGGTERMSLIALGVMPYITASIVVQLAASLHPALASLKKEGESGRKKLNQWTRYGAVLLTAIQAGRSRQVLRLMALRLVFRLLSFRAFCSVFAP